MSDVMIRLKCRTGTFPITVPLACKITDLVERVSVLSEIPVASVKLFLGFPPKPMLTLNCSVGEAGVKSGDTIIVEVDSDSESVNAVKEENESKVLRHVINQEMKDELPLILRKVVPADNSCLFTSLGFALGGNDNNIIYRVFTSNIPIYIVHNVRIQLPNFLRALYIFDGTTTIIIFVNYFQVKLI